MRTSLYLCTAIVGLWLAGGAVGRVNGPGGFMLEVPAQDLSVGQQFQPRLVPTAIPNSSGGSASSLPSASASASATVPETVSVELLDAGGRQLATQEVQFSGSSAAVGAVWSLPRAGAYRVRASAASGTQTVALTALPEPASDLGGVAAFASWGVPAGAADYLRQHGFVVTAIGDAAALPSDPLIVVGDARLNLADGDLAAAYGSLWRAVNDGAGLLVLEPPPPGLRAFWPLQAPLRPATGACSADWDGNPPPGAWAPLPPALAPQLAYDLSGRAALDIYHWDGTYMRRAPGAGYPGCHTLFSYRYGAGWVTVSTAPLLEHFQDVRAREALMALIKAELRRKHYQPASPGLVWVMGQKLEALAKAPPAPLTMDAAVWYIPPPAPVALVPVLAPEASDGDPQTCWTAPAGAAAGAAVRLDLGAPRTVRDLDLSFGGASPDAPSAFQMAASADGVHWTPLAAPAPAPHGPLEIAVPAGAWREFQLTATGASPHPWGVCEFSAH